MVSQPAIYISAWDGRTYTLLPPPLPPSPSVLARPISLPDVIDPELLSSLRIIWGRYTDVHGESIRRDLCSPAGQGIHAKAFYYLLEKYRQESSKSPTDDLESLSLGDPAVVNPETIRSTSLLADSSALATGGLRRYQVPSQHPYISSAHLYPAIVSRKRTFKDGTRPAAKERSDVKRVLRPASHNKMHYDKLKPQNPLTQKETSVSNLYRPKSILSGDENGAGLRPHAPRRDTYSVLSERRDSRRDSKLIGFSQHLQSIQAKSTAATPATTSSHQKLKTSNGPTLGEAEKAVRTTELTARNSVAVNRQSLKSPRLLAKSPGASNVSGRSVAVATELELPLHADDTTENTKLQRVMGDISRKMNDALRVGSQAQLIEMATGKTSTMSHPHVRGPQRTHSREGKENYGVDDEWSHVTMEVTHRTGNYIGDVPINREVGKDIKNVAPQPSKMRKEKERKGRRM